MSVNMAIYAGSIFIAVLIILALLLHIMRLGHDFSKKIKALEVEYQQQLLQARKQSVNSSRAIVKGKVAEQLAPLFPQFDFLPSDAKFLGDPIDYIVFDGYSEFQDGQGAAEDIELVMVDIKSGQARLTKGQKAIQQAIEAGRIRFETIQIDW